MDEQNNNSNKNWTNRYYKKIKFAGKDTFFTTDTHKTNFYWSDLVI